MPNACILKAAVEAGRELNERAMFCELACRIGSSDTQTMKNKDDTQKVMGRGWDGDARDRFTSLDKETDKKDSRRVETIGPGLESPRLKVECFSTMPLPVTAPLVHGASWGRKAVQQATRPEAPICGKAVEWPEESEQAYNSIRAFKCKRTMVRQQKSKRSIV